MIILEHLVELGQLRRPLIPGAVSHTHSLPSHRPCRHQLVAADLRKVDSDVESMQNRVPVHSHDAL